MPSVFFSYSHQDESLRDELEKHLSVLKRQGIITTWHDRRIPAGDALEGAINQAIEEADVILLLVSADFLNSDYCYGVEMLRAMDLHSSGKARVIPVILRPCDWHQTPFGTLLATPRDGKPVTKWTDRDEAFLQITTAIKEAISAERKTPHQKKETNAIKAPISTGPRSSNLRLRKTFSEKDRDVFADETFEFMARFFENTLTELQSRNPGIEGSFKRIDATKFTGAIYQNGKALARCTVRLGGMFGGIALSLGNNQSDNSCNESLSVEADDQSLFIKPMGMGFRSGYDRESKLSQEGAAEYFWSLFFEPLQQ